MKMKTFSKSVMRRGMVMGYRSGLEKSVGEQLASTGLKMGKDWEFECERIPYVGKHHTYPPDFKIGNVYIETKGRFLPKDRSKHLLLKEQYPDMDLRFVFNNPQAKLNKGSKTTYAEWCIKHGFSYAKGVIPDSWLGEFLSTHRALP